MALIGHWMALDESGGTVPDRSASAADGTLTGTAAPGTIGFPVPEAAIICPNGGNFISIADHARWTTNKGILLARMAYLGSGGTNPAWMAHSEGSGSVHKWAWHINTDFSGTQQGIHLNNAGANEFVRSGVQWDLKLAGAVQAVGPVFSVGLKFSAAHGYRWYRDDILEGTSTGTMNTPAVAAALALGYGGEAYFDGKWAIVAARFYDDDADLATDADVLAAMLADAEESVDAGGGGGSFSGAPFSRIHLGM